MTSEERKIVEDFYNGSISLYTRIALSTTAMRLNGKDAQADLQEEMFLKPFEEKADAMKKWLYGGEPNE